MNREQFIRSISSLIDMYIGNFDRFDSNPQIKVNPATLVTDIVNGSELLDGIEYSNEAVEDAAGAQGAASEDATDFQVKRNPDFYAVKKLLFVRGDGQTVPYSKGIDEIADIYFR